MFSPPVTCLTAAVQTTTTSWKTSSCECATVDFILWNTLYLMCLLCSYVVSSLEMLVAEDYLIIYMNGATPRSKMPGISWLKKCYQMIDRRWGK